jgi:hypothetical protein
MKDESTLSVCLLHSESHSDQKMSLFYNIQRLMHDYTVTKES